MESSNAPAAGWFPDPDDASTERWWSGHDWTDHTRASIGREAPASFAAHVETLLAAPPAPKEPAPFVFAMTPTQIGVAQASVAVPATPAEAVEFAPPVDSGAWAFTPNPSPQLVDGFVLPNTVPAAPVFDAPAAPAPIAAVGYTPRAYGAPAAAAAELSAETVVAEPAPSYAAPAPAPAPETMPFSAVFPTTEAPDPAPAAPADSPAAVAAPAPATAPTAAPLTFAPDVVASAPAPTLPAPTAAAPAPVDGFTLPGAAPFAPTLADAPDAAPRPGRHADVVAEQPKPVAAPAVRPVGYTASADPDVANRYRAVIHAADLTEQLPADPSPAVGGWHDAQPAPYATATAPAYAPYSSTHNRPAKAALTSGVLAVVASVLVVVSRMIALPGLLGLVPLALMVVAFIAGLVGIIVGIVGLVVARRVGAGRGAAVGGLLLGVLVSIVLPAGFVVLALVLAQSLGIFTG